VLHFQREMEDKEKIACPECGAIIDDNLPACPECDADLLSRANIRAVTLAKAGAIDGYIQVPRGFGLTKRVWFETFPDEKFLKGYSFGPGCGFYLFNRVFWPWIAWGVFLYLFNEAMNYAAFHASINAGFLLMLIAVVPGVVYLVMYVAMGQTARRRRWERLQWQSFSHFRSNENDWNLLGIIGWAYQLLAVIVMIARYIYLSMTTT
jgi:hypothetical protein